MVRGFVIFYFYITISQVVRGGVQVNRDEVIEEKGPLFEVDYHSILLSLWLKPLYKSYVYKFFCLSIKKKQYLFMHLYPISLALLTYSVLPIDKVR